MSATGPGCRAGAWRRSSGRLGDTALEHTMIAAYAQLSRNSHPRLRFENWERARDAEELHRFQRSERMRRWSPGTAAVAVQLAISALDRRPA